MDRNGAIVAALLVGAGVLAAVVVAGPASMQIVGGSDDPGSTVAATAEGDGGGDVEADTPGPATERGTDGTDGGVVAATPGASVDFGLQVTSVENCGTTCRDVTVSLTNTGGEAASDVTVSSTVLAGSEALVERSREVGRLAPGETVTRTVEVNVGFGDVIAIQGNGGYVTIRTTVDSATHEETFTTRRKVL